MERKLRAAAAYTALGWKLFTVTRDKHPFGNCQNCQPGRCAGGNECGCPHFCHGFYAGTDNLDHIRAMLWRGDGAQLALRTGTASGIFVVDAEGSDKDGYGDTGVSVLDEWEQWTHTELPATRRALTSGGGVHMFYKMPGSAGLKSKNRILPNIDIKADGGYVVLPPAEGRRWLDWRESVAEPGDSLFGYLVSAKGRSAAGYGGMSGVLSLRTADVIPAGSRYEFTRDLVYHLRRTGRGWDEALGICRAYWERYEQPPGDQRVVNGVWFLPFAQVEYELHRVWQRVQPEEPLSFQRMTWAKSLGGK